MPRQKETSTEETSTTAALEYSEEIGFSDAIDYGVLQERIKAAADRATFNLFEVQRLDTALPFNESRKLSIVVTLE